LTYLRVCVSETGIGKPRKQGKAPDGLFPRACGHDAFQTWGVKRQCFCVPLILI
jgi:hypothetical protein